MKIDHAKHGLMLGTMLGRIFVVGNAAALALVGTAASAQSTPPASARPASSNAAPEEATPAIVVTGSRLSRVGFIAPTPVTAVSASEMTVRAPATIADTLATIPAFRAGVTPNTSGVSSRGGGIVTADLRALGASRTLVLVDGHRFVPSGTDGVVDLKLIPQLMIDSVEVVTGGASAAYGSDAVAGVVNFKLNNRLDGVRASIQGGVSQLGDGGTLRASLAAGHSFADGLVHVTIGGDYSKLYGIGNQYSRAWGRQEVGLITNPLYATNGQPNYIIAAGVHPATATSGGLINSGPLRGLQFLPGGATSTFNFGTLYGGAASSMIGGDNVGQNLSNATLLGSPLESIVGLTHIDINASDAIKPYLELSYGNTITKTQSQQPRLTGALAIPVSITNAFLPASVKTAMTNAGLTSITVGRIMNDTGPVQLRISNNTLRAVLGVKGDLGGGWSYDAYYQYGRNKSSIDTGPNNIIFGRFLQEVAGCPGTTAVAGCVPVNIFGDGSVKVDSYAFGTAQFRLKTEQNVAAVSVNGSPVSTWAGPITIAVGGEYRSESAHGTSDPISQLLVPVGTSGQSIAGGYGLGNQLPINGQYHTLEAFAEVVVPLLRDVSIAKSLDLNGAVRRTDYSTSGAVTTWKLGTTWQVNDQLRFRGTHSRDIRAPNLNDLYSFGGSQFGIIFDPVVGGTVQTRFVTNGNTSLKPEKSTTWTGGFVYQPDWLRGAGISLDYYNIKVNGVIGTLTPSVIAARCNAGDTVACGSIVRNANGSYAFFNVTTQNLNALNTSGVDLELRYQHAASVFGDTSGKFNFRLLATYIDNLDTVTPTGVLRRVGTLANFNGSTDTVSGVPHLTGTMDLTLSTTQWLVNLQTRFVGSGKFNRDFTTGTGAANTISKNEVPAYAYLSLSTQYNFKISGREMQVFGTINNLLDTDPPMIPSGTVAFANETSTNPAFYDVVGRAFTFGLRAKF